MGHQHKECPKKRRLVAAAVAPEQPLHWAAESAEEEVRQLADELASLQMVSVSINIDKDRRTQCTNHVALFDTGSPISFAKKSMVPSDVQCGQLAYSNYRGLGQTKLFTYGKIQLTITFRKQSHLLTVLILPDNVLPTSLLLGRDFLQLFNIGLHFNNYKPEISMSKLCIPMTIAL